MDKLSNFIDRASNKVKRHRFHDEELNVVRFNLAVVSYLGEANASLVFAKLEDHFQEGNNSDFLLEVGHFADDVWELADEVLVALDGLIKLVNLPLSKSFHHVIEPFEVGAHQNINDILIKKLTYVENSFSKKD
jgi:hypothetical protein